MPATAIMPSLSPVMRLFHISFYKFVELSPVDALVEWLRKNTQTLTGSILVAPEGINGVLAGTAYQLDEFEQRLTEDLIWGPYFLNMDFKRSACRTRPFSNIKIHSKQEIVAIGLKGINAVDKPGQQLEPQQWRTLLSQENVVVIDNRNSFEYRLGHFKNAIDPHVQNFRNFPEFIKKNAPDWINDHKRIAMYCTGGIRCEKTSAWMETLGIPVYQLKGGILNYFHSLPDAEQDWEGECFVFDNRIALDTRLQQTATVLEDVYQADLDGPWRLARARRLRGN